MLEDTVIMLMRIIQFIVVWVTALVYGASVVVEIVRQIFTRGLFKTFSWKSIQEPACLKDPTLGVHGYLHLQDVRIHYVASGPEDKPLMLFIHGFPEFWYSWRYQIREFQKDYRVVAIDTRGYGGSDKPRGISAYTVKKLTADIKEVILALGYKSCVLVAHDWGGAIAWAFGRHYADMVDKLIVMNAPPSPVFQKLLHKSKEQQKKSWYLFFFQLPFLPELYFKMCDFYMLNIFVGETTHFTSEKVMMNPLNEEDMKAYKYTFSQSGAVTPPINYYRAALQKSRESAMYDMNYTMPVLVVWGLKDIALSPDIPNMIEQEYPSITVKRLAESGHFVQMDTPDLVNKAMREWLNK